MHGYWFNSLGQQEHALLGKFIAFHQNSLVNLSLCQHS